MAQKKNLILIRSRVQITELRQNDEYALLPEDVVGMSGTVQWVTTGFDGNAGMFEIKLDDGRIFNFYATEIELL